MSDLPNFLCPSPTTVQYVGNGISGFADDVMFANNRAGVDDANVVYAHWGAAQRLSDISACFVSFINTTITRQS